MSKAYLLIVVPLIIVIVGQTWLAYKRNTGGK